MRIVRSIVQLTALVSCLSVSASLAHGQDVTFYDDVGYGGESFGSGANMSFVGWDWNDRMSAVDLPSGWTVTLYEHADYGGASLRLSSSVADLREHGGPGPDGTWNDAVSSIMVTPPAASRTFAVLVHGSFNPAPPWTADWSPQFTAVANTYGVVPLRFVWSGYNGVYPPYYGGIYNGAIEFASFMRNLNATASDRVHVVAHSHGGNVIKWGTWAIPGQPISHLVNLGTPINWDLPRVRAGSAASTCQVSGVFDFTQFSGTSPYQWTMWVYYTVLAADEGSNAVIALSQGDMDGYYYHMSMSAYYSYWAWAYWMTTKNDPDMRNTYVWTDDHGLLHEPPVWNAIAPYCATN